MQLLRAPRRQLPAQEGVHLRRAHREQLRQVAGALAAAGQGRLQGIEVGGQHPLDHLQGHRPLADPIGRLQGQAEVLLDLQGGGDGRGQALDGRGGEEFGGAFGGALPEQPVQIGALLALDPVEPEQRGARADLFQGRPAQVVAQLRIASQHHRQRAAVVLHQFDEALEPNQGLGMQVVGLVDEQRDWLLGGNRGRGK